MRKRIVNRLVVCLAMAFCLAAGGCGSADGADGAENQVLGETGSTKTEEGSQQNGENATGAAEGGVGAQEGNRFGDAIKTLENGISISNDSISAENYKYVTCNNPVSSEFYCADPTAVEYEGRLYLFGTNDHEQFEIAGPDKDNTYEKIKSFVVLSTDDMVNWTYHGEINVGEIAPWITNSWAPSIVSRVEEDGLTHFYLYFSNNGLGVGVITATNPLGPWSDPLGEPFISGSTPGLKNCPNPFDPGVVIDDNGDGWLAFGGGKAAGASDYMPGSSKIVKLGENMLSFASEFVDIPAPYFFEASELNYINGTYVYTYNTDWGSHGEKWDYDCNVPSMCSMVYMTTKTPLDSSSWEMKGEYFKNPGLSGFDYSNNHTHLHKFNGEYYIFYHTLMLKGGMGITGAYRSLGVDTIQVDEETVTIKRSGGTKKGISYVTGVNPYEENMAAELNNTAEISYDTINPAEPVVISDNAGSWICVKNVEFTGSGAPVIEEQGEEVQTAVSTIQYKLTVKDVNKETTVSMYPSSKGSGDAAGSVKVTGAGDYTITCDLGDAMMMQNMGYFAVDNDAKITMILESIVVNGTYEFEIASELTNTRDWANGLKNIWNGFEDGAEVYSSENAVFKYVSADDAIEFFAVQLPETEAGSAEEEAEVPLAFFAEVKGKGCIEVRLDKKDGALLTSIAFDTAGEVQIIYNDVVAQTGGMHDLYFVFSDAEIEFTSWKFVKMEE